MRSLVAEARAARHDAVIDEATAEFNSDGAAGASLSAIARRVGLTRAGLYNYFVDREDLVFQCYMRTCSLTQDYLSRAYETPASGAERLGMFIKQSVDIGNSPMAALNEIGFLTDEQQKEIAKARAGNVALLKALLKSGQQDGSMRPCDEDIVCQAILGVVSWAPIARIWLNRPQEEYAARMASAIPDMVVNGVVADHAPLPPMRYSLADVMGERSGDEREQRMEALARLGSRLFNQRGIAGVSLDEVAEEVDATKGALYYYFDSKPAFVAFCYSRAFDIYESIMTAAESCATGLEATRVAIELNVEAQLTDLYPLWLTTGVDALPAKTRTTLQARQKRLSERSFELGRRGMADGSLRHFDLEPVKIAAAGSYNYLSSFLPGVGKKRVAEIAEEISRFMLQGVRSV